MSRVKRKKGLDRHQSPPEQTSAGMRDRAITVCSHMFPICPHTTRRTEDFLLQSFKQPQLAITPPPDEEWRRQKRGVVR